jgi:hypothetical protein
MENMGRSEASDQGSQRDIRIRRNTAKANTLAKSPPRDGLARALRRLKKISGEAYW